MAKKMMKDPKDAWMTVKNKIKANFWKKVITVNNMIMAERIVVTAVAKIDGPILISAYFVLVPRSTVPVNVA